MHHLDIKLPVFLQLPGLVYVNLMLNVHFLDVVFK